ncbi:DUF4097 family beta strand repeat-containing protein [Mammaliicoccus sciuri]|uniref:DUF4097 family beta strand repeat-containing protein n=1 Tax=Mammaliicoccus sciuri TaxID=1296 RepID=UPI00080763E6|nr:DUF4097 family beta strand repeat-containing protein [Mammaliicoccus sciuri]MCH5141301.1 DUF4097 family beta strand repeat protein [Mammaliicoccus sciuri]MEB6696565.1 DUF4097 domain-containing protein [Mammaliicoccus sciuri]OCA11401.1 hypothetical protein BBD66_08420 [Mammaliicoccus sciuri]WQJ73916.1 DUF4097 family beta strand repeat-containing protein [Mammaliicoccus sciuri]
MKKLLWILFSLGLVIFIVFGTLTFAVGKKEADNMKRETILNKTYQEKIKHINVNASDAAVTIKKGDQFKVTSVGNKDEFDITFKVEDETLNVNLKEQNLMINFNFFKNAYNEIEITVPKNLEQLDIKTDTGKINMHDIKSDNTSLVVDTGMINVNGSDLGNFEAYSDTGKILTNKTNFKNGKIQSDTGTVRLNDAPTDTPLDIETDTGSVRLVYNKTLKNTLLDIEQDVGNTQINRAELKNKKVGSGDNLVKIRSDVGSVQID